MKTILHRFLLTALTFLLGVVPAGALTIPASEDSHSTADKLMLSGHRANSLVVDASRKSFLYFDLSDIPSDAVVRWAKLRLFLPMVQRSGAGLSVHLVTSQWEEAKASNIPSISPGTLGIVPPDRMASRRFVTVDVTETVQKWISGGTLNEGFAIQPVMKSGTQTASVMLTSKDGPVFGLPAELDIDFQPEGGVDKPVTIAQLPSEIRALLTPQPIGFNQLPQALKTLVSPTVTVQPVIPPSLSGSLAVQAQGLGNLSYQWLRNGVAITGETSAQLPLRGGLQSGTYTVVVSNGIASVTSEGVQFSDLKSKDLFALVTGGTLPASSQLGFVAENTPRRIPTFYIGRTEVTWGEWRAVRDWAVGNGYSDLADVGSGLGDNYPVTHVNWYDVVKWCNAKSEREGFTPVYRVGEDVYRSGQVDPQTAHSANGYRLPSEAEWEFAARGGIRTNGYTYSGSNNWEQISFVGSIYSVGNFVPNELEIFDMSGNVSEWCTSLSENDAGNLLRVIRGGNWNTMELSAVASRSTYPASINYDDSLGFRLATSGKYAFGITAQPSVSSDGTAISVRAEGAGALTYQWMRNGVAIPGGTASQLSTNGLEDGAYVVVVSNGLTDVTSETVRYPSPMGRFALVTGGTLPASSALGAVPVNTFYIGRTEVTWGEWQTVRTWAVANGYTDLAGVGRGLGTEYPVTDVNWYDAVKWCNARSEMEGKAPVYYVNGAVYKIGRSNPLVVKAANGYRLPTEPEWEFAARGGIKTMGYIYSGSNDPDEVSWNAENSNGNLHPVGKKIANELGVMDMSGSVWEWTFENVAVRGGSYYDAADAWSPVERRNPGFPETGFNHGFRTATSGEYALGITAQPSVSLDGTAISIRAKGAGALTYQWMRNGVAIPGGTASQLSTNGLEDGAYVVVVSNGLTDVTSETVRYPSPMGRFALVTGGTLPASSPLGALPVDTFYIGKTEVTWGEWKAVRDWAVANGYTDLTGVGQGGGENYPVYHVNWYDVVKWCNARSELEGKTPVYMNGADVYRAGEVLDPSVNSTANGYRLPTEAEWEFAARGGTRTNGYTYSGSNNLAAVGWYHANSGQHIHSVGEKLPNELGIFDMSGNLYEWTGSWNPGYEGSSRVMRGGAWSLGPAEDCEVSFKSNISPENRLYDFLGFRVALSSVP